MPIARKSREKNQRSAKKINAHKNLHKHYIITPWIFFTRRGFFSQDFHTSPVFFSHGFSPALVGRLNGEKGGSQINYFLGVEGFQQKIKKDAFLEWEEVYENQYYGTLKSEIERIWEEGKTVIFDVDVVED